MEKPIVSLALAAAFLVSCLFLFGQTRRIDGFALLPNERSCYARLTQKNGPKRRVAFFGSSRMRADIDPNIFAKAGNLDPSAVINLGHSSSDLQFDELLVSQMRDHHPLDLIIVEVNIGSARLDAGQNLIHKDASFRNLATGRFGDLWIATANIEQMIQTMRSAGSLASAFDLTALVKRKLVLAGIITRHQLGEIRRPRISPFRADRDNACVAKNAATAIGQSGTPKQQAEKRTFQELYSEQNSGEANFDVPDFLRLPAKATDRKTIRTLVNFAKSRSIRIAFVYLPIAFIPLPNAEFATQFEHEFGAPIYLPPRNLLKPVYETGFFDSAHMNFEGSRILTSWLAARLLADKAMPS
jgi:hypothetical protein